MINLSRKALSCFRMLIYPGIPRHVVSFQLSAISRPSSHENPLSRSSLDPQERTLYPPAPRSGAGTEAIPFPSLFPLFGSASCSSGQPLLLPVFQIPPSKNHPENYSFLIVLQERILLSAFSYQLSAITFSACPQTMGVLLNLFQSTI